MRLGFLTSSTKSIRAFVLLTIALCVHAPNALACSCISFVHGFIGPEISRLPANAVGIPWFISKNWLIHENQLTINEERFTVEIINAGKFEQIPFDLFPADEYSSPLRGKFKIHLIVPRDGGLQPGASYRVTDHIGTGGNLGSDHQVNVTIDRETLSQDTPFTLEIGPATSERISVAASVSCSLQPGVRQVKLSAWFPEEVRIWQDQLLFRTFVDENQWFYRSSLCDDIEPGSSVDDHGHDRLFVTCDEPPFGELIIETSPLEEGVHTVVMEARLPGTDIVFKTAPKTVELRCPTKNTYEE